MQHQGIAPILMAGCGMMYLSLFFAALIALPFALFVGVRFVARCLNRLQSFRRLNRVRI